MKKLFNNGGSCGGGYGGCGGGPKPSGGCGGGSGGCGGGDQYNFDFREIIDQRRRCY